MDEEFEYSEDVKKMLNEFMEVIDQNSLHPKAADFVKTCFVSVVSNMVAEEIAAEREACAQMLEELADEPLPACRYYNASMKEAAGRATAYKRAIVAIRERGEQ